MEHDPLDNISILYEGKWVQIGGEKAESSPVRPANTPHSLEETASSIRNSNPDERYSGKVIPEALFGREVSVIKVLGYSVGMNSNFRNKKEREEFLDDFLQYELPLSLGAEYVATWGEADSIDRIAHTISHIEGIKFRCESRGNASSYELAISEWAKDLVYLKEKYRQK